MPGPVIKVLSCAGNLQDSRESLICFDLGEALKKSKEIICFVYFLDFVRGGCVWISVCLIVCAMQTPEENIVSFKLELQHFCDLNSGLRGCIANTFNH